MRITKHFFPGFLIMILTALAGSIQAQTAPVVQVCQLSDFTAGPFGHAIYLHQLPGAVTPRYRFDSAGGVFTIFADSTARVTGRVFNDSLPNFQWDVDLWFENQLDFAAWSALGRDVKIEYAPAQVVNANKQDWLFWEFDSLKSRLYGVPGTNFDGDTLNIRHNPPNRQYGMQFGLAANAKNGNFGVSGWFLFDGPGYSGHGDINANASCGPAPCDVDASAVPVCQTDSTFAVSITFTGTGGPFVINDDLATAPLVVNSAGTYLYGNYANGDTVTVFVSDSLAVGCVDTVAGLTADCTPPPVCDVAIDSATTVCISDTTFEISVSISGTGAYTLSDDSGVLATGLVAGSYTFGPYPSSSVVTLFVEDPAIAACADSLGGLTADCTPPPVCDVAIDSATTVCISDTTFEISVSISGTGAYTLSDDSGVLATGLVAGSYTFGPYPSSSVVALFVEDPAIVACTDSLGGLTADCTPPPVCDVAIDSATTVCISDTTFEISVSISGTGAYTLSDDSGVLATGLVAGSYAFGPYPSSSVVTLFVEDPAIAACADSLGGLTADCTPPPVCDVAIDSATTVCISDTTFEISVSISGTGAYTLSDDSGVLATGLVAGSYTFGPYPSSSVVALFVEDPAIAACADSLGGLTADCTPPPVCDVAIDSVSAVCITDSTFELLVSFTGAGPYTLYDDQGTTALSGLSGGTYSYGEYASNQVVTIYLEDPSIIGCVDSLAGLTQTCVPVTPVCGVAVDSVYAECASDTSFTIFVLISGVGNNFQISDDQGSAPVGGLSAGWYSFGDYFNSTEVLLTVSDLTIPGCDTTVGPLTADCTPVAVCDLVIDTVFATCLTDSTFEVTINVLGSSQFYQIFDNQGSVPLFPIDSGQYTFGPYLNGTQVSITVSDLAVFNCFATVGPISETCGSGTLIEPKAKLWAVPENDDIIVAWEADYATLVSGFFVERSLDPELPTEWQTISWVPVTTPVPVPAVYEYVDADMSPMIDYYYRVRIVPTTGNDLYSNEASVRITMPGGIWVGSFYPNPTQGEFVSVGINTPYQTNIEWRLFNTTGTMVNAGWLLIPEGQGSYDIKLGYPTPGIYFLQLWHEGVLLRSKKIVVIN